MLTDKEPTNLCSTCFHYQEIKLRPRTIVLEGAGITPQKYMEQRIQRICGVYQIGIEAEVSECNRYKMAEKEHP